MENLKQVTKNPKKVEAGKKGYQARLLKLKEEILVVILVPSLVLLVVILVPSLVLLVVILVPSGTSGSNPGTISGTTITFSICLIAILAVGLFYNFKKPKQAEKPEHIKKIRPNL